MADDLVFGLGEKAPVAEIPLGGAPGSVVDTNLTLLQSVRVILAVLAGQRSGAGTATEVFKNADGSKTRLTAAVDTNGNRTVTVGDVT